METTNWKLPKLLTQKDARKPKYCIHYKMQALHFEL